VCNSERNLEHLAARELVLAIAYRGRRQQLEALLSLGVTVLRLLGPPLLGGIVRSIEIRSGEFSRTTTRVSPAGLFEDLSGRSIMPFPR